ncbi:MAG: hypothetical protein ACE5JX_13190 [Acidobacteriota bacterium]
MSDQVERSGSAPSSSLRGDYRRMVGVLVLTASAGAGQLSAGQKAAGPYVSPPVKPFIVEVDIRSLPSGRSGGPSVTVPEGISPNAGRGGPASRPATPDPVIQTEASPGLLALSTPAVNVAGMTSFAFPPDTIGDVGRNHYIQMINVTDFQVFDKNGNDLSGGPKDFGSLWPAGNPCSSNTGDPVVVYDHLADRWLLSQFASSSFMCFAVSQGPNPLPPTGASTWFLYSISVPVFPDYPKLGVWPDAYYMTDFESSRLGVFAFDRNAMLAGQPTTFVRFTIPALSGSAPRVTRILPADLDGPPPPPGTPNPFFRTVDDNQDFSDARDRLEIWEFSVDFANPLASTFTLAADLDAGVGLAPFDVMFCNRRGGGSRDCIPQPDTTRNLDALSNRPMMQLKYREFPGHATLVVNQTIEVGGSIPVATKEVGGIRWYELRRSTGGSWAIFQQATYSPQPPAAGESQLLHRWMGSAAMDKDGNIALGYSISNDDSFNKVFPGIRYTGRLAGDPLGTLEAEQTILDGTSAQTNTERWGDYSAMSVDPLNDCTFFYTTHVAGSSGRPTRIASFSFPSCLATTVVGGSVTGMNAGFGLCRNLATSQTVFFSLQGGTSWDCEGEGLAVSPGDSVLMVAQGSANSGLDSLGGGLTGATGNLAVCNNLSTGQVVGIPLAGSASWNCEAGGMVVNPGDSVRISSFSQSN